MKQATTDKDLVIFYHQDCLDGAASLAVANEHYKDKGYNVNAKSLHHSSNEPISQEILDSINPQTEVLFLDVVAPIHLIDTLLDTAKSVTIIDHHPATKHVQNELANNGNTDTTNLHIVYDDSKHSGVTLTFDHFHPEKEPKWYIADIRDIDLGAVEKAKSPQEEIVAISAFIDNMPRDNPQSIIASFEWLDQLSREEALSIGKNFLKSNESEIQEALNTIKFLDVDIETGSFNVPILDIKEGMFSLESESSVFPRAMWPALAEANKDSPLLMISLDRNDEGGRSISLRPNPNSYEAQSLELDTVAKKIHAALGGDGVKAGGRNGATAMHFSSDEWGKIQQKLEDSPFNDMPTGKIVDISSAVELLQSKFNSI